MTLSKLLPILFLSAILVLYSNAVSDNVLDSNGDKLRPGVTYQILPASIEEGGGLAPCNLIVSIAPARCPPDSIFQYADSGGMPVTFTPRNSDVDSILLSAELNIEFKCSWTCSESTVWRAQFSAPHSRDVVTTNGTLGGSDSWFKIETYGNAYKLVYTRPSSFYSDVGVLIVDQEMRYLILTQKPLAVRFHPVAVPADEISKIRMLES